MRTLAPMGILLLVLTVAGLGCGGDDDGGTVPGPTHPEQADSIATATMTVMVDSLDIWFADMDVTEFRALEFEPFRNGFDAAIAADPTCDLAHLGLALCDIIQLNSDEELWGFIDDISDQTAARPLRGRILGHQFRILAEAPRALASLPANLPANLTITELQNRIVGDIMPALGSAIGHLEAATNEGSPHSYQGEIDGEAFEIDAGELHILRASLLAVRAALGMMTAYNLDVRGPDGTLNWLEPWSDQHNSWLQSCYETGDNLYVESFNRLERDSTFVAVLRENLQPGEDYLTLRQGTVSGATAMADARQDLVGVLSALEAAIAAIGAETDPQYDDLIVMGDLDDLDPEPCADCPHFMQNWNDLTDVIDWVQTLLGDQPVIFNEEINGNDVSFQVRLGWWLAHPPADYKALLPLHRWVPPADWFGVDWSEGWSYYSDYRWGCDTEWGPGYCTYRWGIGYLSVLELLDPQGDVIGYLRYKDIDIDVPYYDPEYILDTVELDMDIQYLDNESLYLPDYTLGGLLPGMNRTTWLQLVD